MSTDKETSTDMKPKKKWLMFRRRQKMSGCEPRAAPQEAEEQRDSRAGPGAQAAAAESRAAAPHSPRARGHAVLRSLRRGSRAILSRVAAVIRRRSQQPATQRHLDEGMEPVRAATAPAAGAQSRAAPPQGPSCRPTTPSTPLEALAGQGAGAALGAVPKTTDGEENDWELSSPKELSQGDQKPEQRCRSGEVRPPCTASGQASALPSRASDSWAEDSSCEAVLALLPPSPSPSQVEARRQWAIAAAKILLAGLPSEEGDSSEDVPDSSNSSGDESVYVSCEDEPKPLEPSNSTGHLGLTPQTRDQAAAKGEDMKSKELSEEKSGAITIRSIWVNPRYPQLLAHPDTPLEEEAAGDLPSTSRALAAPRDAQAAAAALAGAPEDEEHPVRARALPQEVAKTAASAGPGAQAAAAESRAAAPHSPRARGHAVLRSLRRGSRAILSRVAAVIRRRSQQPATQRHLDEGMELVRAARAPAAGAQSLAAPPQGPSCRPTTPSTPLEALAGQGAGAALGAVPKTTDGEENDWELSSPKELSQGDQKPEQRCRSGEVRPPVRPGEAGVEHSNVPPCTASGQASALPSRASDSWAEDSSCEAVLALLPPSPSPSQVEARRQWAIAAAKILLAGLPSEEGDSSEDVPDSSNSSGDESVYVSCEDEPKPLEPSNSTGHLGLTPQTRDQAAAKGEDMKSKELSEEKSGAITIRSIWVNPRYPQLLAHPDTPLEEEAAGDLPSTSRALAAPRNAQAAAAALAGAPEDEEHPVRARALPQEVAKTAASAGPGAQAAAAESRAAAPHSPRAFGQALLRSLRRGSRAILSMVAAVIRRRSQQPRTQKRRHQGLEPVRAARAPAAGAQSSAAAPHSPCSPSSHWPTLLEALYGQGPGAALEAALPLPAREWKVCLLLEPDWEGDSTKSCPKMNKSKIRAGKREQRPPERPRKAWL